MYTGWCTLAGCQSGLSAHNIVLKPSVARWLGCLLHLCYFVYRQSSNGQSRNAFHDQQLIGYWFMCARVRSTPLPLAIITVFPVWGATVKGARWFRADGERMRMSTRAQQTIWRLARTNTNCKMGKRWKDILIVCFYWREYLMIAIKNVGTYILYISFIHSFYMKVICYHVFVRWLLTHFVNGFFRAYCVWLVTVRGWHKWASQPSHATSNGLQCLNIRITLW